MFAQAEGTQEFQDIGIPVLKPGQCGANRNQWPPYLPATILSFFFPSSSSVRENLDHLIQFNLMTEENSSGQVFCFFHHLRLTER